MCEFEVIAPAYLRLNPDSNTNLTSLVDAWGKGFVDELDYTKEVSRRCRSFFTAAVSCALGSFASAHAAALLQHALMCTPSPPPFSHDRSVVGSR